MASDKRTVYVETTIPSFYYEVRPEPAMVARRELTRRWWAIAVDRDDLVTSAAVTDELREGEYASREDCLSLLSELPLLPVTHSVVRVVQTYIDRHVVPAEPTGDALHLALASCHACNVLVTWNCRHLANVNKIGHMRAVNRELGLRLPTIVTPQTLLEERDHGH